VAAGQGVVTTDVDVLVVGAGPAGLTAALQVHAHGGSVRVVEQRERPDRASRAMIMHPRTLELLRPLGVTDEMLARGDTRLRATLHLGRREVRVSLDDLDLPETEFPHLTLLPQIQVEQILAKALADRGVPVERGTKLLRVDAAADAATATLRTPSSVEQLTSRFVAGCDGQNSTVRRAVRVGWHSRPYAEEVVLADVHLSGGIDPGEMHVAAAAGGLVFLFPLDQHGQWRLMATRPSCRRDGGYGRASGSVQPDEVQDVLDDAALTADVRELTWSGVVPLQRGLADDFASGPVFLAGDAAHAHSPAGAQGMNTGIADAVNLGWKLAYAGASADPGALLGSYPSERRPVARRVMSLTHVLFLAEASTLPPPRFLRGSVAPLLAPAVPVLLAQERLLSEVVRLLSQLWVGYRASPLSVEDGARQTPGPRAGDRLPDQAAVCGGRRVRVHDLTAEVPGVHLLLSCDAPDPEPGPPGGRVTVHRLDDRPGHGVVAVRPDGHVGYRSGAADPDGLRAWLRLVGAREGPT
jgi:2-polyprenyl-6-methoxyphenol hydroxylase-like FAD-dependent oxidoreductase